MGSRPYLKKGGSLVRISQLSNDMDQETESLATYTVQVPITPDNQPMSAKDITLERSTSRRVEDQYASSSMFTGGFNQATRAQFKDKVIESESSHPQMAGTKGSACEMSGCDGKVMTDERGLEILPCECDFKICRNCYKDTLRNGEGVCPGCNEAYKEQAMEEAAAAVNRQSLPLPPGASKMERRLSMMKSGNLMRSQTNEFDHAQWLSETKGTYGYGNAMWPKDPVNGASSSSGSDWMGGDPNAFKEKPWRPLTRKLNIRAAILSPYRYDYFFHLASFISPGCVDKFFCIPFSY